MKFVTNIFRIVNLNELSSQYRLIELKGLRPDSKDYQANKQFLIDKFSKILRHPVTILETEGSSKMVIKDDVVILNKLKENYDFGRITLYLKLSTEIFNIDFINPSNEVKKICLRFLQFDLNGELKKNLNLWQPYTGAPFFLKISESLDNISIYKGFTFRVIELPIGGFGITIDATRKFASSIALPYYIEKNLFDRTIKRKSFIYQYKDWFEIKPMELDDLNVTQRKVEGVSLIDYVRNIIPKPHSIQLANIPKDSSVIDYYASNLEARGVPSGLCYEVFDFQDTHNPEINRKSIISPQNRFFEIKDYKNRFFNNLYFGKTKLVLSDKTLDIEPKTFEYADVELGNNVIVSTKDFRKEEKDLPSKAAKLRMNKLMDPAVGFYTKSVMQDQVFVLPRSINDTKGESFLALLKDTVNSMYPYDNYEPKIITFEDKFKLGTDYLAVGRHIIQAIKVNIDKNKSYRGVVMIPRLEKKAKREHDKLSALIIRELRELNIHCSIIHTDTVNQCYAAQKNTEGKVTYTIKFEKKNKLNGYLKNVAINKVLLNSNKWPFVLSKPLYADITIGIDVKHHTAGFTIIDKHGKNIRTELSQTSNKEKLTVDQLKSTFYKIIKSEFEIDPSQVISKIVIHRDGRIFDTELEGILEGLEILKQEQLLPIDANVNVIEIPKKSFLSFRLFGLTRDSNNKTKIENPPIGLYYLLKNEAFICTTGKEFLHAGTTNPLFVKFVYGEMSKENLLSDLYHLTCLAFTKPDDCSRFPLTIKINDIKLSDSASEYDEDNFKNIQTILENLNITIQ